MEQVQNDTFLCDRCGNLDTQCLLSSTRYNPWRPWQVADVVESAAATACTFCCLLVNTLRLVHDEQGRNSTFTDKALLKISKSKSVARFFADKAERMQRERDGWISFFVPEELRDGQDVEEDQSEDITRIIIAVTGSKHADGNREAEFNLAPGPGISSTSSELPSLFPRGTLLQNTSQSLTELSTVIQTWRQHCHDTHECWKPLAQRRNRNVEYVMAVGGSEIIRYDWYVKNSPDNQTPILSHELPPLELEHGRLDSTALPSRCLEVVAGDDGQCWFWLRETAGKVGKYVILSHRWVADTERVRTLQSNYKVRVGGFDDSEIPPIAPGDVTKVFQEVSIILLLLRIPVFYVLERSRTHHFRTRSRWLTCTRQRN